MRTRVCDRGRRPHKAGADVARSRLDGTTARDRAREGALPKCSPGLGPWAAPGEPRMRARVCGRGRGGGRYKGRAEVSFEAGLLHGTNAMRTYTSIYIHVVFATWNRRPFLQSSFRSS